MDQAIYRFAFPAPVPMAEVEATLALALLAVESLHGEAEARLDAGHAFDAWRRCCAIDGGTPAGRNLIRLFTGFLTREFGPGGFSVERLDPNRIAGCPGRQSGTAARSLDEVPTA